MIKARRGGTRRVCEGPLFRIWNNDKKTDASIRPSIRSNYQRSLPLHLIQNIPAAERKGLTEKDEWPGVRRMREWRIPDVANLLEGVLAQRCFAIIPEDNTAFVVCRITALLCCSILLHT